MNEKELPRFPSISLPDKIIQEMFHVILPSDLQTKEDIEELLYLLYEYPERKFYLFLEENTKVDINLNKYGILTNEIENYYYKIPNTIDNFVKIGNPQFEWEEKLKEDGPMYIRVKLELSERTRRKMFIKEKIMLEQQLENINPKDEREHNQNIDRLIDSLQKLAPGTENAKSYEKLILQILTELFSPELQDPHPQVCTHDSREIVDITFFNYAEKGFWYDIKSRHNSMIIVFECKNITKLQNEDYFQIAARLDKNRGKFGILIVREKSNLDEQRAYRRLNNEEKVVLTLADVDLIKMLNDLKIGLNGTNHLSKLYREFIEKA